MYMSESVFEDNEVEALCDIIEDISEEDGKTRQYRGGWKNVTAVSQTENLLNHN
jgi:hypothetical protein